MKAAVLSTPAPISTSPLKIEDIPTPEPKPGHVLLKVRACGVCRTDLHIVEGELPPRNPRITPGHQIVGEIVAGEIPEIRGGATGASRPLSKGARVGVSWMGGVDGTCFYCLHEMENLCDSPTFTGYSVNGGYAEYALARADFCFPIPAALDDLHAAPLLCAGIIGFRALRVAGVEKGDRVGLFGFGASAHLAIRCFMHGSATVYVSTRGESHRQVGVEVGRKMGGQRNRVGRPSNWIVPITFAPSGDVVIAALASLRKGGSGRDQRDSSRPYSAIRLRQTAVGRAADPQRRQHDPHRRYAISCNWRQT